jgi:hypothetical protein
MPYEAQSEGPPTEDGLRELVKAAKEAGEDHILLETTHDAGDAWIRAGFSEVKRILTAPAEAIESHLGRERDPSFGSIHVQSDDLDAITRAVRQFVPRLPGRSTGSVIAPPRDGWTSVYDELTDREPEMLRRLARELSDRMGAFVVAIGVEEGSVVRYVALERGRVVDEYLSVPEFYGPLPPGDVIALGANPRLMGRMTGADPEAVRATARTAAAPAELPAARELLVEIAALFALPGATHGYPEARAVDGAVDLPR